MDVQVVQMRVLVEEECTIATDRDGDDDFCMRAIVFACLVRGIETAGPATSRVADCVPVPRWWRVVLHRNWERIGLREGVRTIE